MSGSVTSHKTSSTTWKQSYSKLTVHCTTTTKQGTSLTFQITTLISISYGLILNKLQYVKTNICLTTKKTCSHKFHNFFPKNCAKITKKRQ